MKRTTKSIFALIIVLVMCVSFCVPTFAEVAAVADTAAEGTTAAVNCPGKDKQHKLNILGLTPETATEYVVRVVPAPCQGRGFTIYKCPVCGEQFADNWVDGDAAEHTYDEANAETKQPTCTEDGYIKYTCTKCGDVVTEPLKSQGHKWSDWVAYKDGVKVDSFLCTDTGITKERTCACGATETETVNAGEHKLTETWVYPTCQSKGTVTYECEKCDYVHVVDAYVDMDNLPAAYHTNLEYDVTAEGYVKPTCSAEGLAVNAYCKDCGATGNFKLPTVDHNWKDVEANDPTCYLAGNKAHVKCEDCGKLSFDKKTIVEDSKVVLPALGHKNKVKIDAESASNSCYPGAAPIEGYVAGTLVPMAEAVVLTEANKGWGIVVYTCPDCDDAKFVEYIAPDKHANLGDYLEKPTHEKFGFKGVICLDCGFFDRETMVMLPPYTHVVENVNKVPSNMKLVNKVEPQCGTEGTYTYECEVCKEDGIADRYYDLKIDATGHKHVETVVNPTCHADGYTWMICSCGDVLKTVEGKTDIDAEGKYDHKTTAEYMIEINYENLDPANDADYAILKAFHYTANTEKVTTTAPTCTLNGWSRTFCEKCSWYADRQDVPALNHPQANWTNVQDVTADCLNDGGTEWTCGLCGHEGFTKSADKLGHIFYENGHADWFDATKNQYYKLNADGTKTYLGVRVQVVEPTCTTGGYTVIACGRCGTQENWLPTAKLGHSFEADDFVATRPNPENPAYSYVEYPTCDGTTVKNGSWVYICQHAGCDVEHKVAITDKNDPDYDFDFHNPKHHTNASKIGDFRVPTCSASGIEKWYCDDCDKRNGETSGEYDDVTSGTFDVAVDQLSCEDYKINEIKRVDETCFAAGNYAAFECSKCGTKYYYDHKNDNALVKYTDAKEIVIPQRQHQYDADDTCANTNPCTQPNCDYEKPALKHTLVNVDKKDATCTAIGWYAYEYCTKCDYTTYKEIKKTAHSVVAGTPVAPTCTEIGYTYYACTTCDTQDYIDYFKPANRHTYNDTPDTIIEPTCTKDGKKIYNCTVCGVAGAKEEVIPNKYNYVHKNAAGQAFTDECQAGIDDYFCVQCNATVAVTHGDTTTIIDSVDCKEYVYEISMCSRCNKVTAQKTYQNDEHVWGTPYVAVQPTLTTEGVMRTECQICTVHKDDAIPPVVGVGFDFEITNLAGAKETDGYAGRIKLVINMTASEGIKASNVILNIGFNNALVNFVGGNLLSTDFTGGVATFTALDKANAKGYVVVTAGSLVGDVTLTSGVFAELYFDITVDNAQAVGQTAAFNVNTATTDGSAPSAVTKEDNGEITELYSAIESVLVARAGDLTADQDDKVDGDDAAVLLQILKAKYAGEAYTYRSEADLNRDGDITAEDYMIMAQLNNGSVDYNELDEHAVALKK